MEIPTRQRIARPSAFYVCLDDGKAITRLFDTREEAQQWIDSPLTRGLYRTEQTQMRIVTAYS